MSPAPGNGYKARPTGDDTAITDSPTGDKSVADFLQLLGRAARQFHTYPATSPMCQDAIDACHRAFTFLDRKGVMLRVASRELIVDENRVGRGTVIEQDLAKPLHRARVASVEIEHTISPRDWSQFCTALSGCHRPTKAKTTFAELLLEAGVGAIVVRMVPRPEVVELGAPAPAVRNLVVKERARHASRTSGGGVQYFYPPDKGWIRLDPTIKYDSISLLDLAVVVNDPTELAQILMRLTDDEGEGEVEPGVALERKYSDLVTLISALDPRLARQLFAKMAHAVLDLDATGRGRLLRRSILPGLIDGSAGSEAVLNAFPDVDLADALCLLLDFETAAPDLLAAAVDRLNLAPDRRQAVVPLIQERLRSGSDASTTGRRVNDLAAYAAALVRVDSTQRKSFAEFAAFDLSLNDEAVATLGALRDAIAATTAAEARLACLSSLTRLEPNPEVVGIFVGRAVDTLGEFARAGQWDRVLHWLKRFAETASTLKTSRPDVGEAVRQLSIRFCSRDLIEELAELCGRGEQERAQVDALIAVLGPSIVPSWLDALESPKERSRLSPLMPLLCRHARDLAATVSRLLPDCSNEALLVGIELLGAAGGGYEAAIMAQLPRTNQSSGREALRALARIGTNRAAGIVADQIENGPPWITAAAEEALWHLPTALGITTACQLLARRSFVLQRPECASRLLARVTNTGGNAPPPLLDNLASLRYYFWNPAVARVGMKARELKR